MAFVLQWGVIGHALWDHDRTLTTGSVHRFQVQPIDPRDPFRGEYVILDLAAENVQDADTSALFGANDPVYGTLGMDSSGYAIITALSKEAPEGDHVECRIEAVYSSTIRVELPFDRYYLQEGKGGMVESLLDMATRRDDQAEEAYILVRVREGKGVIEDLVIGGRSVEDHLRESAP
ncbi:MAG: GDYXXLXY domain-containing protein [Flavobacteriales bacterium]|nr:GDYXXLXY domain-containing protein [Flavobacteriales bacterium]MCB0793643.1 GDYXXLXY domain-containing protein [Flavobacteriales bacterium]